MIAKFVITKKSNGYTGISAYEYSETLKDFEPMPYMSTGDYFIESMLSNNELKYYRKYKKSGSKRNFFYGIVGLFKNPAYQHILGTA